MFDRVLGIFAFGRAPKRGVRIVLFGLALSAAGMIASGAFAAGPRPEVQRVDTRDTNGDGYIDAVVITFSTPMDTAVQSPGGFYVAGFQTMSPPSAWLSAAQLQVNLIPNAAGPGDTNLRPSVAYLAGGAAPARSAPPLGEELATQTVAGSKIFDDAGPALMRVVAADYGDPNIFNAQRDELRFHFSEPVKLIGQTPTDRLKALDVAVRFSSLGSCPNNPADGDAANGKSNFPSVVAATSPDPIVVPAVDGLAQVVVVRKGAASDHGNSTILNPAVPGFCVVGVDPNGVANIVDGAAPANNASSQDIGGPGRWRRDIEIAPAGLKADANGVAQIYTKDLQPSGGDGIIDAIAVSFDHPLDDATVSNAIASKFSVRLGTQTATIVGVETGTANDDTLLVKIGGVSWAGGQKPGVSYDGSLCILKAKTPTPTYPACADTFGIPTRVSSLDGVPPAVTGARTLDVNGNGRIDAVRVTFTETVADAVAKDGWTVAGQPATTITHVSNTGEITLGIAESAALGTGATPAVAYDPSAGNTTDLAGAELVAQSFNASDGAAPKVVGATTLDADGNGGVDRVTIQFSEPVLSSGLDASLFEVGGTPATGFGASALDPAAADGDALVTVTVSKSGTGRFGVRFTGAIPDAAGNINAAGFTLASADVSDAAKPVVTSLSTTPVSPFKAGTIAVSATFSEALDGNVAPAAAIGGKPATPFVDANHTVNGFRTDDPAAWEGAVEFSTADCAEQTGCALELTLTGAKDPSGNVSHAATPVGVVLDTLAPSGATGETVAAIQQAGAPAIDSNSAGSRTANLRLTATIAPGQVSTGGAGNGTASLLADGQMLATTPVSGSATSVTIATAFATPAALQAAIPEGARVFKVRLCDSAGNCAESNGVTVTADYTAPAITLGAPNAGSFTGGDHVCIQYQADATAARFQSVELRFVAPPSVSSPVSIASGLPAGGSLACGAPAGGGYDWTLPALNTSALRVQVVSTDGFANQGIAASASDMTVETVTSTVLTIAPSPSSLVYGASATIRGTLSGGGYGASGRSVQIQRRAIGATAFTTIATVTTAGDGSYAHTLAPDRRYDYRAVFDRSGPYLASTSEIRHINVAVAVSSAVNATSFARGQTFRIAGKVQPAHAGKQVWFQAYIGGKWVTLSRLTLGPGGAYSFGYRSTSPVKLLFRVAFPTQDSDHAWNISRRYMVTWT